MFDAQRSFADNLDAFKVACEKIDADCAKILFDNIGLLIEHGADRETRTLFNSKVKTALGALSSEGQGK